MKLRNSLFYACFCIYRIVEKFAAALPSTKLLQQSLSSKYKEMAFDRACLPGISDVGLRFFSQADEDGILLFLFSIIGSTNKKFIEIGASYCIECNCANLLLNHGWHGLFVDGNSFAIGVGRQFYRLHPDTRSYPPKFACNNDYPGKCE